MRIYPGQEYVVTYRVVDNHGQVVNDYPVDLWVNIETEE